MHESRSLFELGAPVVVPDVTHYKVVKMEWELDRSEAGKPGHFKVWVAKVYRDGDRWVELGQQTDPLSPLGVMELQFRQDSSPSYGDMIAQPIPPGVATIGDLETWLYGVLSASGMLPAGAVVQY